MDHNEKINYMRIAAGIAGMGFKNQQLDLLVSLYDDVLKQKGKTTISDVVDIEFSVERRAKEAEIEKRKSEVV